MPIRNRLLDFRMNLVLLVGLIASSTLVGSSPQKTESVSAPVPISAASGDFNDDGHQDLIAGYAESSGGSVAIFINDGYESYQLHETYRFELPIRPDFLVAGDFNGDGLIDAVAGDRGGSSLHFFSRPGTRQ